MITKYIINLLPSKAEGCKTVPELFGDGEESFWFDAKNLYDSAQVRIEYFVRIYYYAI